MKDCADALPACFDGSFLGLSQHVLEFGEDLFDRVQVRTVGWQDEEPCACSPDGCSDGFCLVAAEIVHDDEVPGLQGRDEELFDVAQEALAIDLAVKHARSGDGFLAKSREEGQRLPVAVRNIGIETLALLAPAADRGHVGLVQKVMLRASAG